MLRLMYFGQALRFRLFTLFASFKIPELFKTRIPLVPNMKVRTQVQPKYPAEEMDGTCEGDRSIQVVHYSRPHRSIVGKYPVDSTMNASSRDKKKGKPKMGGLSLPDVVRVLLKDNAVLKWDTSESLYEVIDGHKFEARYKFIRASK
jgi:hypothetical protein